MGLISSHIIFFQSEKIICLFVVAGLKECKFLFADLILIKMPTFTSLSSRSSFALPPRWSHKTSLRASENLLTDKCCQCNTACVNNEKSPKRIYKCNLCNYVCTWAYDFSLHMRQKHGILKK